MEKLKLLTLAAVSAGLLSGCQMAGKGSSEDQLVSEYDALATKLLANEKRELEIMKSLLEIYKGQASTAFIALKTQGADTAKAFDDAIEAVNKLAQEGDKRVYDIKLRLQKGGHHHTKAEDSDEEYIYVSSKAKKELTAQANKLRALKAAGKPPAAAEVDEIQKAVNEQVDAALKSKG